MNSNRASDFSNKANRFISWFGNTAKKAATAFTKKKRPAVDKELVEAISCIEWRTKYDQQRIIHYIYTASFKKNHSELYNSLNMSLPVKHLLSDEKANVETTDNSFERKLVRWFKELNPTTKQLLDGVKTKHQRWLKTNTRITELYLNRPQMHGAKSSLNGYERQLLQVLTEQNVITHIPTAPVLPLPGTVTPEKESEVAIDVVAETLSIEITEQPIEVEQAVVLENTTPLTDTELTKLRQAMIGKTSINKLTIPNLRLYAKARSIRVPGSTTKVKDIRKIVATAQGGSTKLIEI